MKKTNFKRIVSFMLMLVMLMGLVSINVFAAEADDQSTAPSVEITGRNVMYGDYFYLVYSVEASNVPDGAEIAIDLTLAGSPISATYEYIDTKEESKKYGLSVGSHMFIANTGVAAHAAETVYTAKAKIVNGDNVVAESAVCKYSILEYMYQRLYTGDNLSEADRALCESYLAFAEAAEAKFDKAANQVIASSVYVCTENLTFNGGDTAGTFVKGSTLSDFAPATEVPEGYTVVYIATDLLTGNSKEVDVENGFVLDGSYKFTYNLVENGGDAPDVEPVVKTTTYTFSDYAAGGQYAENEFHELDANTSITTNDCHFTSELRIYSSSTNNGYAIIKSLVPISAIGVNAGNKADTLKVYGSNDDGATWVEVAAFATSTSYKDYSATLNSNYKWLKLDVEGTQQVRVKTITLTTVSDCAHANTAVDVKDPTCIEEGYTVTTCTDCGMEISRVESDKLPHTDVNPADHNCDNCDETAISDCKDDNGDNKCDICSANMSDAPVVEEHKVTMDIFANKGTLANKVITWTSGDVTVSNAQASSTTAIRTSDSDHYRIYQDSKFIISADGGAIKQIVITCTTSSYANVLVTSANKVSGLSATASGSTVTITVSSAESVTISLSAQVRVKNIAVTYEK